MRNLYPVRLDGIGLDAIDPRIRIIDVTEEAPKIKITTQTKTKYDGLRVLRRERESRAITISLVIWERDKAQRSALLTQIAEWADAGGALTIGYREGQQINVLCAKLPDISGRKWTEAIDIEFMAFDPYWRGIDPLISGPHTISAGSGTPGTISRVVRPCGTAKQAFLEFDIESNSAATMTNIKVSANGAHIELAGISLASGKKVALRYDTSGFMSIMADGVSILGKRTAASADDLILNQREDNAVTVRTSTHAFVTLRAWEQWK